MKEISITSTSYVFPQNQYWKNLKNKYEVKFLDYGKIFGLSQKKNIYKSKKNLTKFEFNMIKKN